MVVLWWRITWRDAAGSVGRLRQPEAAYSAAASSFPHAGGQFIQKFDTLGVTALMLRDEVGICLNNQLRCNRTGAPFASFQCLA